MRVAGDGPAAPVCGSGPGEFAGPESVTDGGVCRQLSRGHASTEIATQLVRLIAAIQIRMVFFAKKAEVTQTIRRYARIVVASESDHMGVVSR